MKDKNLIFFREKGITSTSANHLANIAKQLVDHQAAKLEATTFVTTNATLLSSGVEKITQKGYDEETVGEIQPIILEISKMNAFCAWMREAIKAKEEELKDINSLTLERFCEIQKIELKKPPVRLTPLTVDDAIGKIFNIAERFRYYELEATASTIGKYIHPGNKFYNARANMHTKICNPNSTNGSGSEMIIYSHTPSCPPEKVEQLFISLQSEHRANEASLNSMKYKIKEAVDSSEADVNRKYKQELDNYVEHKNELIARMNIFIDEEKVKILNLKIIVPNFLESTFKHLSSL